ncbi:MAG: chemotaxis protein CheC [Oscillospiraceae bacterium]|nr:chemotaxis protein CheC [Oscillospiraceae bacterium]
MAVENFSQFNEMHISVLQELGNMGSGGAATALATMLGSATDISVPVVRAVSLTEARNLINTLSGVTVALLITLKGDFKGYVLHLIPYKFAERVIETYFPGTVINSAADIDEMALSVVKEMVNITTGAYVNGISQLSGIFIDISTPEKYADMASEIFKNYSAGENSLYFVNNTIVIKDKDQKSNMLYFPELESAKKLMTGLGIEC